MAALLPCSPALQLLQEIRKVNFTLLGQRIFFDQHGDLPMPLEVVQWQWNLSQGSFQSIASYHPTQRQLRVIRRVSWHTPDGAVSSQRGWGRALLGRPGPILPRSAPKIHYP